MKHAMLICAKELQTSSAEGAVTAHRCQCTQRRMSSIPRAARHREVTWSCCTSSWRSRRGMREPALTPARAGA